MLFTTAAAHLLAVSLSLASLALAIPAPIIQSSLCQTHTDTFDDLPFTLLPQLAPPIGTYNGVTYQAFEIGSASILTGANVGVVPASSPNGATATINSDLLRIGAVTLNPFGNIVAPPSKSFDLISFRFGCGQQAANAQVPSVAIGCTLSVTGYNKYGEVVPAATFSFTPTNVLRSEMVLATLPSTFVEMSSVTIGIASTSLLTAGSLLYMDNVVHCN